MYSNKYLNSDSCIQIDIYTQTYHLFSRCSHLVTRANEWLRRNNHVRVKTCESIEVKGRYDGMVDTNKSSYFEADHSKRKMRNMYIRALR